MLPGTRAAGRRVGSASRRAFNNGSKGPPEQVPPALKTTAVAAKLVKDGDASRAAFEALLAQGHANKAAKAAKDNAATAGLSLGQAAVASVLLGFGSMLAAVTVHANRDPAFRAQANAALASLPTQPTVPLIPSLFVADPPRDSSAPAAATKSLESEQPAPAVTKDAEADAQAARAAADQKAAAVEAQKKADAAAQAAADAQSAADAQATAELVVAAAQDAQAAVAQAAAAQAAAAQAATAQAAASQADASQADAAADARAAVAETQDAENAAALAAVTGSAGGAGQPVRVRAARGAEAALAALDADLKRLDAAADLARFDNIEAVLRDVEVGARTRTLSLSLSLSLGTAIGCTHVFLARSARAQRMA